MNTMEITKVVGGVAGSLLILMLLKMGASSYYIGGKGEGAEPAYTIAVADSAPAEEVEAVPFSEILAAADAGAGARVYNKCAACHAVDPGVVKVGPSLFGVVDRGIGAEEFGYSSTLAELGGDWTPEALNEFLTKPTTYAPGTSMSFGGLKKEKDRANLIAYLSTLQ
ncbi:MAG: c-type cytochrome [Rhodobacteraceae bacterium]|nr:c-type cytochrome [Paracoccaceae bacterium]